MYSEFRQWFIGRYFRAPDSRLPGCTSSPKGSPAAFLATYDERMTAFPRLCIGRDALLAYCGPTCLGSITDRFDCLAPRVLGRPKTLERLGNIHKAMELLKEDDQKILRMVVNDLLVTACLVPVEVTERASRYDSSFPFQMELRRRSLQLLSPKMFKRIILELSVSLILKRISFGSTALLSHLPTPALYSAHTPLVRLLYLSLANWSMEVRSDVINDPLWPLVIAAPNLGDWMLSCSDADEQIYVNSCEPAASNSGLVAHAAHPLILLAAARRVVTHVRERRLPYCDKSQVAYYSVWPYTAPSVHTYVKHILDRVTGMLENAWGEASRLLKESQTRRSSWMELHSVTKMWHHALQTLSPVYVPHQPSVLTRKFFSEWWTFSAHLVSIFCVVGSFIPCQPFLLARRRGLKAQSPTMLSLCCFSLYMNKEYFNDFSLRFIHVTKDARADMLTRLWLAAYDMGGVCVLSKEVLYAQRVTHLTFVTALEDSTGQRVFLIADPEINGWKLVSFADMELFVADPLLCVELMGID